MSERRLPPVIVLGSSSDRAAIACLRSLDLANVPSYICLPESDETIRWRLTSYRDRVLPRRYDPLETPEAFVGSLLRATSNFPTAILYPTNETLARALSKYKERLREHDIVLPLPSFETYATLSDKEPLMEVASRFGIDTPEKIDSGAPPGVPFVAKPKENVKDGQQLRVYLVHDESDKDFFIDDTDPTDYFYQRYVDGTSIYYCALFRDGTPVREFVQKTVVQQPHGGSVIMARPLTSFPSSLRSKVTALMEHLEWNGVAMIEFRKTDDGYYLIEVNPRFWGPLQLCIDNGVQLPLLLYEQCVAREFDGDFDVDPRDGITDDDVPEGEYRGWHGNEYGYFRVNGFIKGWWEQFLVGGSFERNRNPSDEEYRYRDVWLRPDSFPVFLLANLDALFRPLSVVARSPARAWEYGVQRIKNL